MSSSPCATGYFFSAWQKCNILIAGTKVVVFLVLQATFLTVASMSKPRHGLVAPRPKKLSVAQGKLLYLDRVYESSSFPLATGYFLDESQSGIHGVEIYDDSHSAHREERNENRKNETNRS